MNLEHFGDSYDIVKQALLGWLADVGPWAAHPMFTHHVSPERARAFGEFLGVPLVSRVRLAPDMDPKACFEACSGVGRNLFLDPDTGLKIRPKGQSTRRHPQYLYTDELAAMAKARPHRLTMTFDQSLSRARDAKIQIKEKLRALQKEGLVGFAYVSHVAFIIVGCDAALVKRARKALLRRSRLPEDRIVQGGPGL